ncbi:uncharacterized protein LOC119392840 [Rhipicephalus sanguineus]|uniref:uncharacterized protein LOC119392840 n=1 Tax=Rhipicephalus sanguineus TaxID=34632 RepID=UPI0018957FAE|nr:uncharacterized protein LOC119392840 [Rhipicephalus sanguineus]
MSLLTDGPCVRRAVTKRNWDSSKDWKVGATAHRLTPDYEHEPVHVSARLEMLRSLDAVHYADHGLRSEVDRLLRLPLLKGWPSGPVFRGSTVSEAPLTTETAQSAAGRRSRIPSWPPTKMATSANLRPPSEASFDGCAFCRTNGERRSFYTSHALREDSGPGSKGRVTCPVLRNYQCPQCGYPGGDEAHTLRYCPLNKDYIAPSVYKTPRKSNGQPRRRPRAAGGSQCFGSQGKPSPDASVSARRVDSRKPSESQVCPVGPRIRQSFSRSTVRGPRSAVEFQRW